MPRRLILPRTYWADRTLLALIIAASAWLALTLARGPGELAAIWIGNGVLVGWLLSRRTASWPGYLAVAFAAELPARMAAGDEAGYAIAIAACNLVEVLVVAGAVRKVVPSPPKLSARPKCGAVPGSRSNADKSSASTCLAASRLLTWRATSAVSGRYG